jgi:hypothetical protein
VLEETTAVDVQKENREYGKRTMRTGTPNTPNRKIYVEI